MGVNMFTFFFKTLAKRFESNAMPFSFENYLNFFSIAIVFRWNMSLTDRIRESNHDVNFELCVYTVECVWKLYFGNDFLYGYTSVVFCACAIFFPWHLLHISFSHLAADVCLCGIHIIWCIIISRNFPTQTRCNWLSNKSIWWRMNSKIANSYASAFSLNGFDFALFFSTRSFSYSCAQISIKTSSKVLSLGVSIQLSSLSWCSTKLKPVFFLNHPLSATLHSNGTIFICFFFLVKFILWINSTHLITICCITGPKTS